jgi:hypothetical protein
LEILWEDNGVKWAEQKEILELTKEKEKEIEIKKDVQVKRFKK